MSGQGAAQLTETVAGPAVPAGCASAPRQISIDGGPSFTVRADEDSLLRGALRAGIAFPYECSVGGCGSCRFELLDGEVQTLWDQAPGLSERERRRGRRLACQSRPLGDCRIRARLAPVLQDESLPRRMPGRLLARRALTHDMTEFSFAVDRQARFRAGQYALLYLPGTAGARAYSMSHDDIGDGCWRFIVRRVPGGAGSAALFDCLAVGDVIELDGPYGHAWLHDGEHDIVCVAGGSGLGPMLSVAEGALARDDGRRVHVLLGLRSQADLGAAQPLLARQSPRLAVQVVLSQPDPGLGWAGPTGFVHEAVAAALDAPLPGFDFYLAGPSPMVNAVQDMLILQHRVPHAQVRFDRFV